MHSTCGTWLCIGTYKYILFNKLLNNYEYGRVHVVAQSTHDIKNVKFFLIQYFDRDL